MTLAGISHLPSLVIGGRRRQQEGFNLALIEADFSARQADERDTPGFRQAHGSAAWIAKESVNVAGCEQVSHCRHVTTVFQDKIRLVDQLEPVEMS